MDGACSVGKFNAYEAKSLVNSHQGYDVFVCALHGNHLVQAFIVAIIGLDVLSSMYSLSILLRQGAYFLRVVLAARLIVRNPNLTVRLTEPGSDEQRELSREAFWLGDPSVQ